MKIEQNQIDSTEPFGILDGKTINLVKLKGGLNIATMGDQVLGAASHQAILCYSVEQRFPNFQPAIMKSENIKYSADSHSHFLTSDLRKSGHDIYSVQNDTSIEFFITKQNIRVGSAQAIISGENLLVKSLDVSKEFINSLSSAVSEKALSSGLKSVKVQ